MINYPVPLNNMMIQENTIKIKNFIKNKSKELLSKKKISNKNNLKKNILKLNWEQMFYDYITKHIDFSLFQCECDSTDWSVHCHYDRRVNFLGRMIRIRVTRMICCECGKTHAVFIEDMIPFSAIGYIDIVKVLSDAVSSVLDLSHISYIISRHNHQLNMTYIECFYLHSRNLPCLRKLST